MLNDKIESIDLRDKNLSWQHRDKLFFDKAVQYNSIVQEFLTAEQKPEKYYPRFINFDNHAIYDIIVNELIATNVIPVLYMDSFLFQLQFMCFIDKTLSDTKTVFIPHNDGLNDISNSWNDKFKEYEEKYENEAFLKETSEIVKWILENYSLQINKLEKNEKYYSFAVNENKVVWENHLLELEQHVVHERGKSFRPFTIKDNIPLNIVDPLLLNKLYLYGALKVHGKQIFNNEYSSQIFKEMFFEQPSSSESSDIRFNNYELIDFELDRLIIKTLT